MMKKVDLYYLSQNNVGGWVTYTVQLIHALEKVGVNVNLYKITKKTESKRRNFGFGVEYRNVSLEMALFNCTRNVSLITALAKKYTEIAGTLHGAGASLVIHDPTELKNLPKNLDHTDCISVGEYAKNAFLPQSTFIPHPYKILNKIVNRTYKKAIYKKHIVKHAVSFSRIDFDKHTEILLDANRLLPEDWKINIWGFENRIYTKFKIVPKYPEWEQSKVAYPRTPRSAYGLASQHRFHVDMTEIKGDGGRTQYTFLEAWDAGTINIINSKWIKDYGNVMLPDVNCLIASDGKELALKLSEWPSVDEQARIIEAGEEQLREHDPVLVGNMFIKFFEAKLERNTKLK